MNATLRDCVGDLTLSAFDRGEFASLSGLAYQVLAPEPRHLLGEATAEPATAKRAKTRLG